MFDPVFHVTRLLLNNTYYIFHPPTYETALTPMTATKYGGMADKTAYDELL